MQLAHIEVWTAVLCSGNTLSKAAQIAYAAALRSDPIYVFLQGGIQHVRLQRDPVQPRVPSPR